MQESKYVLSLGAPFSFALRRNSIIVMLFWALPISTVQLEEVDYLRLASLSEAPWYFILLNLDRLFSHQRSREPIYVVRTHSGKRYFMAMESGAHFRLRQAIGNITEQHGRRQR
ncbi:MAG: hypothetical protein JXR25_10040 [Pontiellaceae bacterium]|nr:hypothetical protein [Pontiellaceae bacterium]MBN2785158.1 hypothetical protein [Pontiellaceae bacterium]